MMRWIAVDGATDVAREASQRISAAASSAISQHGYFSLVLAGGSTPLTAYKLLAQSDLDCSAWRLYFGDERCLPADDPNRNSVMVAQTGLSEKAGEVFVMRAEWGAERAAEHYRRIVDEAVPFDMVLLGMGEDGHTASLFPGHVEKSASVFSVYDSPKPPAERVSLSTAALQNCREMLALIVGDAKSRSLRAWKAGADLPISRVCACRQCQVLYDRDLLEGKA